MRVSLAGALLLLLTSPVLSRAATWFPLGPFGGDARAFAADTHNPRHLYVGTATGWLYDSQDGGKSWKRVAQIAHRNDLVIEHVLLDTTNAQRLIVGAYSVDHPDGGVYISEDGGKNWYEQAQMHGQSIRALARADENPMMLIAGTLDGVFRSLDNGRHWDLISPEGSTEIHEVESIAIDPKDPKIIYAGTWHLPWKTVDGGEHWANIKEGIIDDSDVFSIIVDPHAPNIVYASACSGIYKSVTAGEPNPSDRGNRFSKVQGIPSTARRTRKLTQDPNHPQTVYAGTTEGLYRTLDGGAHWDRMTAAALIVNDVFVDPADSDHVLLATDRGGVLASNDAATTFNSSNTGFSARQVTAYASDPSRSSMLYVGVVNDKDSGGVFQSGDGGLSWMQQSGGLGGRDVFSLGTTHGGILLAGTNHGIYRRDGELWNDATAEQVPQTTVRPAARPLPRRQPVPARKTSRTRRPPAKRVGRKKAAPAKPKPVETAAAPKTPKPRLDSLIFAMVSNGAAIYAGTSQGLWRADADGGNWTADTTLDLPEVRFLAVQDSLIAAAGLKQIWLASGADGEWKLVPLPGGLTQISALAVDGRGNIWAGGREGVFVTTNQGGAWQQPANLYVRSVDGLFYDHAGDRVLVTSADSPIVFAAHLPDFKVTYWDTGWKLRFARPVGDHLLGATLYDGIVIQPQMVDSKVAESRTISSTVDAAKAASALPVPAR